MAFRNGVFFFTVINHDKPPKSTGSSSSSSSGIKHHKHLLEIIRIYHLESAIKSVPIFHRCSPSKNPWPLGASVPGAGVQREAHHALTEGQHQLCGGGVQHVARGHQGLATGDIGGPWTFF